MEEVFKASHAIKCDLYKWLLFTEMHVCFLEHLQDSAITSSQSISVTVKHSKTEQKHFILNHFICSQWTLTQPASACQSNTALHYSEIRREGTHIPWVSNTSVSSVMLKRANQSFLCICKTSGISSCWRLDPELTHTWETTGWRSLGYWKYFEIQIWHQ